MHIINACTNQSLIKCHLVWHSMKPSQNAIQAWCYFGFKLVIPRPCWACLQPHLLLQQRSVHNLKTHVVLALTQSNLLCFFVQLKNPTVLFYVVSFLLLFFVVAVAVIFLKRSSEVSAHLCGSQSIKQTTKVLNVLSTMGGVHILYRLLPLTFFLLKSALYSLNAMDLEKIISFTYTV